MLKLTLMDDNNPVWVAAWHVELVCQSLDVGRSGTKIVLVGQVVTYVRETASDVALLVSTRGRPG